MHESEEMKWVRKVKGELYEEMKEMNAKQRIAYLRTQAIEANKKLHLKSVAKV